MRRLTELEYNILRMIAAAGGSFCPDDTASPEALKALNDLVKAKRLRTEGTDAGPRFHLTGQGAVDATS
jgi:hypothetical protein